MFETYIALLWLCTAIVFGEIIYVILQRPSFYQNVLTICLSSLMVWIIGYIIELKYGALGQAEMALIGTKISYIGKPFTMLSIMYFLFRYYNISLPRWLNAFLIIFHAAIAVIAFTCTEHTLFYSSIDFDAEKCVLILKHGVFYKIYAASIVVYFMINVYLGYRALKTTYDAVTRLRTLLIFGLIASGGGSFIIFLTVDTNGIDPTVFGSALSAMFLFILFWRFRFFDVLTYAKERMIDELNDGFIVENAQKQIEYKNKKAELLFPHINTPQKEINLIQKLADLAAKNEPMIFGNSVYSVSCQKIVKEDIFFRRVFELTDISDRYNYTRHLQEEVKQQTEHIRNIQYKMTESFGALAEARDDFTAKHIQQTSKYVKELCMALVEKGVYTDVLTDSYIETLVHVAPLHDIGKIAMPDQILKKPGKLTPEEYDIIKSHTVVGAEIVENTFFNVESRDYVCMAKDVALYHHEHWNGKGYPKGIAEMDIPLSAQIMSICDVYDALRSERVYKAAYSHEKSVEIIASGRGTQFNPALVDTFLEMIEKN